MYPSTASGNKVRRPAALMAALLLSTACAWAQPVAPLSKRLADIREVNPFAPERALPLLLAVETEARRGSLADKAEMLSETCAAYGWLGEFASANRYCAELLALGRGAKDKAVEAKGLLSTARLKSAQNDTKASHALIWQAEQLAAGTNDAEIRARAAIWSALAHSEAGNFTQALDTLLRMLTYARTRGTTMQQVLILHAVASLYLKVNEFEKGFKALDEAMVLAKVGIAPGRLALLKTTEFALAAETGQLQRALKAQLEALALQRRVGATSSIRYSLANLSDCYLKIGDYRSALAYGNESLTAAMKVNDERVMATAYVNIGQAEIALGYLANGKRHFDTGLKIYEKEGDKAELQQLLLDYGNTLEKAGDATGAIKAYHRERALSKDLFEAQRNRAILELQEKFDSDKKQRQIELLETENQVKSAQLGNRQLQQRIWWLLALVFALAAAVVGLLYRRVRKTNTRLYVKNEQLQQQSVRDPLTGLYNRRYLHEYMREHANDARPGPGQADADLVSAVFLMDVDHFKHINDSWGHGAGDAVLVQVAKSLREILRENDVIVRWGGEEFLAFLPMIPRDGLEDVARRLLNGIATTRIVYGDSSLAAKVSIGYAPCLPDAVVRNWESMVGLVDMALYMAKGQGRNRAIGVKHIAATEQPLAAKIGDDLEQAWRDGVVELAIVTGEAPDPVFAPSPSPETSHAGLSG